MSYIVNGECLEEMKKIPSHTVDMICCDLPYGETDNKWDKKINIKDLWKQMKRVTKLSANIILFCSTRFGAELIMNSGGCFCYDLVWEKSKAQGFLGAKKLPLRGHEMIYVFSNKCRNDINREFNQKNRAYAKKCVEYMGVPLKKVHESMGNGAASHFLTHNGEQFSLPSKSAYEKLSKLWKLHKMDGYLTWDQLYEQIDNPVIPKKTYNPQMTKGKPYKSNGGGPLPNYGGRRTSPNTNNGTRYPKSVLKFNNPQKSIHPTQKPQDLCEWLVKTYSNPGEVVLDMTMGSGSTIAACIATGRKYIGIELDDDIFHDASERLSALKLDEE
jgi:DNA modification methylase